MTVLKAWRASICRLPWAVGAVRRIVAAGSTGWNHACVNLVRSERETLLLASTALELRLPLTSRSLWRTGLAPSTRG